jgi:uncharacterized protein
MSRPRALVYGRRHGAPYHPLGPIEAPVTSLLEPNYDVEVSDAAEDLMALEETTLVVGLDDRFDDPVAPGALAAVEAWVRSGGHLLVVHNGICWARDPRWRRLIGGRFTRHGPAKALTFIRRDGSSFEVFDEPYRFSIPWFSGNHLLAVYKDAGRFWPAAWTRKVGGGRVTYSTPGHFPEVWEQSVYRGWLSEWASLNFGG